jgi:hypothetical protein
MKYIRGRSGTYYKWGHVIGFYLQQKGAIEVIFSVVPSPLDPVCHEIT